VDQRTGSLQSKIRVRAVGCRTKAKMTFNLSWADKINDGSCDADGLACETAGGGAYPSAVEQPSFDCVSATACGGEGSL